MALFAAAPAGLDEALPEDVEEAMSPLGEKAWEGDFRGFVQLLQASPKPAEELNRPKDVLNFSRITPFCLLLERIYLDGSLSKATEALRISVHFGDWKESFTRSESWTDSVYPFALLLRILIKEKQVATPDGAELINLSLAHGARWVTNESPVAFADHFLFLHMLRDFCESGTLAEPSSLKLLADSLQGVTGSGGRPAMGKLFEGGGTMFSNVVGIAMKHDIFGTAAGDALLDFCLAHGASWDCQDGWNQSAFLEMLECAISQNPRRRWKSQRTLEENFLVVKDILERQQAPAKLWNTLQDRSAGEACESTFYDMLISLAENGLVGHPITRAYIHLGESFGARWDCIGWNYSPPWNVSQKGRLTNFHRLVDKLGPDQCGHADGVSILSQALENGADFAIDDPNLPGKRRYVAHIPRLLWAPRRQLLCLLALCCCGRAAETAPEASEMAAVAWLGGLARKHGEVQMQVGHPIVRLVFSFLPRVPPVLGYDFSTDRGRKGVQKTEQRPRSADEGLCGI